MKKPIAFALVSLLASSASADITKIGDFALGQKLDKSTVKMGTYFGCKGGITQQVDKGAIVRVSFESQSCKAADVEAQIQKEYGNAAPIVSVDKTAKLWEGKTGSVVVITSVSGAVGVKVLPPGAGAKRACFADDGFAAFFKDFKAALDKPDVAAKQFKLPIKDFDGKVVAKDAKALAKLLPAMIDKADRKELAAGTLSATCDLSLSTYNLRLGNSNASFEAKQVGGTWQWVEINAEAGG